MVLRGLWDDAGGIHGLPIHATTKLMPLPSYASSEGGGGVGGGGGGGGGIDIQVFKSGTSDLRLEYLN